jgi:hypothetical protein
MVHPGSKLLFSLAPIVCCRAAISGSFPSHHFPQVYLAFSLAFQHITKRKQKSNFFYFIKNSLLVHDVKYSSRRSKERSLISPEAVAAVTRPFYLILIRQFPELIETGLLLSRILFKHMGAPVAGLEHRRICLGPLPMLIERTIKFSHEI